MKDSRYATSQEGPFYRVRPRAVEGTGARLQSLREEGGSNPDNARRSPQHAAPKPLSGEEIRELIRSKNNVAHEAADQYSRQFLGKSYAQMPNTESSLQKQGPIGRIQMLAHSEDPTYKEAVFEAYRRKMPEVVGDARDYDDLRARAYRQLNHETKLQFDSLPVNMSFHRAGEGDYRNSKEMLHDVHNNRHLSVFQGGDPHDMMSDVDPETGLTSTELFRAVHDFYGHAVHGNEFGPKGEESAWAAHSAMYSPLANLAMTPETRGANSVVNYSPLNAELKHGVRKATEAAHEAMRRGHHEEAEKFLAHKRALLGGFQYAPNKGSLLPPEFLKGDYKGGVPGYLRAAIKPAHGIEAELTHFSPDPALTQTDPTRYGTGIKGADAPRLESPAAQRDRTYFYAGRPERGEMGLGAHRYRATVPNLYDVATDPEKLHRLAIEHNVNPVTAKYNPGVAYPQEAFTDLERLAHEYGYSGVLNKNLGMPTAAVFKPTKVTRYAQGGLAQLKR
jgi:hypothetical protein